MSLAERLCRQLAADSMKPQGTRKELMRLLADFSTIGLSLASSIFVGFGMGYLLDEKLFGGRTTPWFMLIFFGFGVFAGFRTLYRLTRRNDL
ncbi:MAG: AtpZ/AtpI family protein [Desulfobulbaceae bacterium]|nr:AtpZ/AtpI family protein [Desulfobulbaceae bacterium]